MLIVPADFGAVNFANETERRFAIRIIMNPGTDADDIWIVSHTDVTPTPGTVLLARINSISDSSQQLQPDRAVARIGALSFQATDIDGSITGKLREELLSNLRGYRQKLVEFHLGDVRIAFANYQKIRTQLLSRASFSAGVWSFNCLDKQSLEKPQIFRTVETGLAASIDTDDTTITVLDASVFSGLDHGTSYTDAPSTDDVFYFKIDDEIIRALTTDIAGNVISNCVRARFRTVAAAHAHDPNATDDRQKKVEEVVYLELPAPKLIYAVQTGILIQQTGTLPSNWDADMSAQDISLAEYQDIGVDIYDELDDTIGQPLTFIDPPATTLKRFIEEEVMKVLSLFQPVLADGRLGLRRLSRISGVSAPSMVIDDNVLLQPFTYQEAGERCYNQLQVLWNKIGGEFTRRLKIIDAASIAKWGETNEIDFEAGGLHGSRHTASSVKDVIQRWLDRWSGGPPKVGKAVIPVNWAVLEVGDLVLVKSQFTEDLSQAGKGEFLKRGDSGNLVLNTFTDSSLSAVQDGTDAESPTYVRIIAEAIARKFGDEVKLIANVADQTDQFTDILVGWGAASTAYTVCFFALSKDSNDLELDVEGSASANITIDATDTLERWRFYNWQITTGASPADPAIRIDRDSGATAYDGSIYMTGIVIVEGTHTFTADDFRYYNFYRMMEIQGMKPDWARGTLALDLFASHGPSTVGLPTATGTVIADAWYTATGTNVTTRPNITDTGSIVEVTSDETLAGNASMLNAGAIWYATKGLQVNAGVTLFIEDNVQLRVLGNLQINGEIVCTGGGLVGVADAYDETDFPFYPSTIGPIAISPAFQDGVAGGFGSTEADGALLKRTREAGEFFAGLYKGSIQSVRMPITKHKASAFDVLPQFNIQWDGVGSVLNGIPDDLRGTSGGPGGPHHFSDTRDGNIRETVAGGTGGDGGGGLCIVARGVTFGGSGFIRSNGTDGAIGTTNGAHEQPGYSGGGAGGAPGGTLIIIDGALNNIPTLGGATEAVYGISPINDAAVRVVNVLFQSDGWNLSFGPPPSPIPDNATSFYASATSGVDAGLAAFRVQLVPPVTTAEEDQDDTLDVADVQNITFAIAQSYNDPAVVADVRTELSIFTILLTITEVSTTDAYSHANIFHRRVTGPSQPSVDTFVGRADPSLVFDLPSDTEDYLITAKAVLVNGFEAQDPASWHTDTISAEEGRGLSPPVPTSIVVSAKTFEVDVTVIIPARSSGEGLAETVEVFFGTDLNDEFGETASIGEYPVGPGTTAGTRQIRLQHRSVADFAGGKTVFYFAKSVNKYGSSGEFPVSGSGVSITIPRPTAVPPQLSTGAGGDMTLDINVDEDFVADIGEIRVTGKHFIHPDGRVFNLAGFNLVGNGQRIDTPFEGGNAAPPNEVFFLMFTEQEASARFTSLTFPQTNVHLVPVTWDSAQDIFEVWDNTTSPETFVPVSSDAVFAVGTRILDGAGGIDTLSIIGNFSAAIQSTGLIHQTTFEAGYKSMEGKRSFDDVSGNGTDAEASGLTANDWRTFKGGPVGVFAKHFQGVTAPTVKRHRGLWLLNDSERSVHRKLTVSLWYRPTTDNVTQTVGRVINAGAGEYGALIYKSSPTFPGGEETLQLIKPSTGAGIDAVTVKQGLWSLIQLVWDFDDFTATFNDTTIRCYSLREDGLEEFAEYVNGSNADPTTEVSGLMIGGNFTSLSDGKPDIDGSDTNVAQAFGDYADIRIYSEKHTAADLRKKFFDRPTYVFRSATQQPREEFLVAHYPMDVIEAGSTPNASSRAFGAAIINGNPVVVDGRVGRAIEFDGAGDFLELPDLDVDQNNRDGFSISMFVNPDDLAIAGDEVIYFMDEDSDNSLTIKRINAGNDAKIQVQAIQSPTTYTVESLDSRLFGFDAGTWMQLGFVFDKSDRRGTIYKNGEVVGETSLFLGTAFDGPGDGVKTRHRIGTDPGGTLDFDGKIEEFRIWQEALTDAEMRTMYLQPGGPKSGTVGANRTTPTQLGIKVNQSTFTNSDPGEMYIHGFDDAGQAADVDGRLTGADGQILTIPKDAIFAGSVANQAGYLCFHLTDSEFFAGAPAGNRQMVLGWQDSAGAWQYDTNSGSAAFPSEPLDSIVAIGTAKNDAGDSIVSVSAWAQAIPLSQVVQQDSSSGADWDVNVANRPTELTDGRVSAGLEVDGDVARTVPDAQISVGSVTQHEPSIDHDNLANSVADEHVAHAGVDVVAGAGLTGGGAIDATRTLDVGAGVGIAVGADDVAVDFRIAEATVQTTDATLTTLQTVTIASGDQRLLHIRGYAHEPATDDMIWFFIRLGVKNVAGTVSIIGTAVIDTGSDAGASAWTMVASASGADVLIRVTGEAAHTINWSATTTNDPI